MEPSRSYSDIITELDYLEDKDGKYEELWISLIKKLVYMDNVFLSKDTLTMLLISKEIDKYPELLDRVKFLLK